jgi:glutathione S-transferase
MFGNGQYVKQLQRSSLAPQAATELVAMGRSRVLSYLEKTLQSMSDCEALSSGKEGVATIADCVLFAALQFVRGIYGKDLAKGFPNVVMFFEAFQKRSSAVMENYPPPGMEVWSETWVDGVWD